jgi:hypothetical protein
MLPNFLEIYPLNAAVVVIVSATDVECCFRVIFSFLILITDRNLTLHGTLLPVMFEHLAPVKAS